MSTESAIDEQLAAIRERPDPIPWGDLLFALCCGRVELAWEYLLSLARIVPVRIRFRLCLWRYKRATRKLRTLEQRIAAAAPLDGPIFIQIDNRELARRVVRRRN